MYPNEKYNFIRIFIDFWMKFIKFKDNSINNILYVVYFSLFFNLNAIVTFIFVFYDFI
jgi:hypothetical protein